MLNWLFILVKLNFDFVSMRKKKSFLLLEILVAILLVSICLVPLIQSPIQSYRAERRLLEEMEGERLADWTFSEIKEKLLKNEIPWDKLPGPEKKSAPFPLPPGSIEIPGSKPKRIGRSFVLECGKKGEKEGLQGEIVRIFRVGIDFDPRLLQRKSGKNDYSYRLIVRKMPRDKKGVG